MKCVLWNANAENMTCCDENNVPCPQVCTRALRSMFDTPKKDSLPCECYCNDEYELEWMRDKNNSTAYGRCAPKSA